MRLLLVVGLPFQQTLLLNIKTIKHIVYLQHPHLVNFYFSDFSGCCSYTFAGLMVVYTISCWLLQQHQLYSFYKKDYHYQTSQLQCACASLKCSFYHEYTSPPVIKYNFTSFNVQRSSCFFFLFFFNTFLVLCCVVLSTQ